jgi:hypothetical protein
MDAALKGFGDVVARMTIWYERYVQGAPGPAVP